MSQTLPRRLVLALEIVADGAPRRLTKRERQELLDAGLVRVNRPWTDLDDLDKIDDLCWVFTPAGEAVIDGKPVDDGWRERGRASLEEAEMAYQEGLPELKATPRTAVAAEDKELMSALQSAHHAFRAMDRRF